MGFVITAVILLVLCLIPLGIQGQYRSGDARLHLLIGPIRIALNRQKTTEKKKTDKDTFASHEVKKEKLSLKSITRYKPLVQPVLKFLADFKKKLRVRNLQLKVVLAGGDPCDLSIQYGRAWMALGNLMPYLERFFVIKKRNLEIACDYTGEKTTVDFSFSLSITVLRLLQILIYHGVSILRQYGKINKNTKDGVAL